MQAKTNNSQNIVYTLSMPGGRPAIKKATDLGLRISQARKDAGLTQRELAEKAKVTQRVIAYWERESVSLKAEQIQHLAAALNVSVDFLMGVVKQSSQKGGVVGRAKKLLEEVQSLPRAKQRRVLDILETILAGEAARG